MTNAELEKLVDTNDEWITSRTGIKERRIAERHENTSTFAIEASRRALEMATVAPADIDLIVLATITADVPFPATACIVQGELQATNAVAFDISAACSGFIYGLSIAQQYIENGAAKRALVIGAEVLSRIVDWTDRNTCILFGDGAGAVVLEATEEDRGILSSHIYTNGSQWELLHQPGPGIRHPAYEQETIDKRLLYLKMEGNEVFKHAVRGMEDAALAALAANGLSPSDLKLLIPHQANRRIIDAIGKRLGLTDEQVYVNLDRFGNTSAATIPIALDEAVRGGCIDAGDYILLDAFGGGFTFGSALVRW
jgi:3-oxoacyl-[acyl-carrier-protein] synthase-3